MADKEDMLNLEYLQELFPCRVNLKKYYRRLELASIANEEMSEFDESDFIILKTYLTCMKRYKENRWWLSEDIIVKAYYQLHEDCKLVRLTEVQKGLQKLLNRNIQREEILYNKDALRREADICYFNYITNI